MNVNDCDHHVYYFFDRSRALCLHKLFKRKLIGAISREVLRDGTVEFYIWREKLEKQTRGRYAGKYKLFGTRSRLTNREQIIFAIAMAEQNNIQRVRL